MSTLVATANIDYHLPLPTAHDALRTVLAHGQAKLTVERTSRWAAIFRVIAIRARQADRSTLVIEESEAAERLQQLRKVSQKLCSALGNLRRAVAV